MIASRWIALSSAIAMAAATFTMATAARAAVCTSDPECAAATPNTPHCNNNVCAQCSNDSHCAAAGTRTPKCLPTGICGCTDDKSCGGENSGLICTGTSPAAGTPPYCVTGCAVDGDAGPRNECPTGYTCSQTNGTVGQCQRACIVLANECPTSNPVNQCKIITLPNLGDCVECRTNGECNGRPGAEICRVSSNSCVQCVTNADCTGKANGPICRTGSSCGCNVDTDCGTGRICEATTKVCLAGCRGSGGVDGGGNCPPGTTCNASGGGSGQCVPVSDGGTDAGDAGSDGGTGDGSVGDGSAGDGGEEDGGEEDGGEEDASADGSTGDGSVEDGSTGDGSTGDGGADGGGDAADAGRSDAGDGGSGNDAGDNNGNYMTSLEGGGCDCSVVPSEDSLPIGGLLAVGGFFAFFTRRRARSPKKDEGTDQP
ncbi:MYXO-CTERM sorting domain-containing protein [Pendulispora rubella]|uniref:MYXO-CTERM sorting domain-containing protein n=1 Tax=Pendulispora rubella TaxID=2741070 RepID=A0ABZ2L0C4_9BACT